MELNIDYYYHKQLIERYLVMCGYTDGKFVKDVEILKQTEVVDCNYPYNEIDDIDDEECGDLYKRIVCGDADTSDKLKYV